MTSASRSCWSQRLQRQSDWGAPGGNTLDPDSAHEALAFPSEAWVPRPVLAWDAVGATNAQRHVTAHPEVATDTASVRGYDYRLVFTADLASPAWTPYPGATRAGNGLPVDLGWLPLTEAEYRFLRVERKPAEVP